MTVFFDQDPRNGCFVDWLSPQEMKQQFPNPPDAYRDGIFREVCHGSSYDPTGARVFGPSPFDLSRFAVTLEDGRVVVDTSAVVCSGPAAGISEAGGFRCYTEVGGSPYILSETGERIPLSGGE